MIILNYKTDEQIGKAEIDEAAYAKLLDSDTSSSGAVRAGDWLTEEQLEDLDIEADLTIYADC